MQKETFIFRVRKLGSIGVFNTYIRILACSRDEAWMLWCNRKQSDKWEVFSVYDEDDGSKDCNEVIEYTIQ